MMKLKKSNLLLNIECLDLNIESGIIVVREYSKSAKSLQDTVIPKNTKLLHRSPGIQMVLVGHTRVAEYVESALVRAIQQLGASRA